MGASMDADIDGIVDGTENRAEQARQYAEQLAVQLRKGFLAYCVLLICGESAQYTSDIIGRLREAELVVVEGTIYPLLGRLHKDGLLEHEWRESEQGPPRKYYRLTPYGKAVVRHMKGHIETLNTTLIALEKGEEQ